MLKKDLLALPVAQPSPLVGNPEVVNRICRFRLHSVKREAVLVCDIFNHDDGVLLFRAFMWGRRFVTFECDRFRTIWHESKLDNLFWGRHVSDEDSLGAVREFLGEAGQDPFEDVLRWQEGIRADQLHVKHTKVLKKVEAVMAGVKPLPDGLDKWVDDDLLVNERYLTYWYSRCKEQDAFCTHCESHVKVKGLKDGMLATCPNCLSLAKGLALGRISKHGFMRYYHFSVLQKFGQDGVVVRYFNTSRQFAFRAKNELVATDKVEEAVRTVYAKPWDKGVDYEWGMYKSNSRNGYSWIPYASMPVEDSRICPLGIEALADTFLKYSGIQSFSQCSNTVNVWRYISCVEKMPQVELLAKAGLYRLVADIINRSRWDHTELMKEDIGVLRRHADELRMYNGGLQALQAFCALERSGKKADPSDVVRFSEIAQHDSKSICDVMSYANLRKAIEYIQGPAGKTFHKYVWLKPGVTVRDLLDYWSTAKLVGLNMRDKNVLFPENLQEADAAVVAQYNLAKSEIVSKGVRKAARSLKGRYSFKALGMQIVIPKSYEDFVHEGDELSHCVRTYAAKVAKGETSILFVRKQEDPDTPFFTMEVKDGRVAQLRGKGNCSPTKEVERFEWKFCEACKIAPLSA